jgi:hypothetical protein
VSHRYPVLPKAHRRIEGTEPHGAFYLFFRVDSLKGGDGPMTGPHLHFCGIHMAKKDDKKQFITQHYCAAHTGKDGDKVFQCVLFDGTGPNAKLVGVEYLISDAQYRKLPESEKKFWHAHTYEVLGGGLIGPGMKPEEEAAFMEVIINTWGKAWHTWPDTDKAVPVGEPMLIWSLMGEGQVDKNVLAKRDVAVQWCKRATEHASSYGGKPWRYALIPHDAIAENMTLDFLLSQYGS